MKEKKFNDIIYPSITGSENKDWQNKLKEVNDFGLTKVAVFLEHFDKQQRVPLYKSLLKSGIKEVSLVHLQADTDKKDIEFFMNNFNTQYFNIHEEDFAILDRWKGYWNRIYLEMNYDDVVAKNVLVRKIGGFCVDLSHLKSAIARGTEEAFYVFSRKNKIKFACNHLSGYDDLTMKDIHPVSDLKQFDYLTSLPKFVFGNVIAIEVENSISVQLRFKDYLVNLLNKYFS